MKSIIEYIRESILDDFDTLSKNADKEIKQRIKQFLKDNFIGASKCKISKKPNDDGKYVVDCSGNVEVTNLSIITSLVNEYFVWGIVNGDFDCSSCNSLISLEGGPEKVGGNFYCDFCNSLISLEGAPKEVGKNFYCNTCNSLETLKGAPKKVGEDFYCYVCKSLTSLEGAPKEVGGDFDCSDCTSLKSYDVDSNIKGKFIK